MIAHKCKKSVFCVLFLLSFFIGTICGVFCFRCVSAQMSTLSQYTSFISSNAAFYVNLLRASLRPLIIVALIGICPAGAKCVWALIIARGFLVTYLCCTVGCCFGDLLVIYVKELLFLPLFYWLCFWAYTRWDISRHLR